MTYLVFYVNNHVEHCVQILTRGFACTPAELPREIKTRCRARNVIDVQLYDPGSGAAEVICEDAKRRGWKVERAA